MATYSLATAGTHHQFLPRGALKTLVVPDADQNANAIRDKVTASGDGGINYGTALTMRTGSQVLCKNLDGSLSWFYIDPTLSMPGALVLRPV